MELKIELGGVILLAVAAAVAFAIYDVNIGTDCKHFTNQKVVDAWAQETFPGQEYIVSCLKYNPRAEYADRAYVRCTLRLNYAAYPIECPVSKKCTAETKCVLSAGAGGY